VHDVIRIENDSASFVLSDDDLPKTQNFPHIISVMGLQGWGKSSMLNDLFNTHWLEYTSLLLEATSRIIQIMEKGFSVLSHCSDGWDRTTQLTALSTLCMDPYYRTILGFEVLIEKEWCSFGHQFQRRYGHSSKEEETERSPIFLQFIDCVFQLLKQHPSAFEFNEVFLIEILDSLFNCKYGTFLGNNEKERMEIKDRTLSLWTVINSDLTKFKNAFFLLSPTTTIYPAFAVEDMVFWNNYYFRWHRRQKTSITLDGRGKMYAHQVDELLTQLRKYESKIESLKNENENLKLKLSKYEKN